MKPRDLRSEAADDLAPYRIGLRGKIDPRWEIWLEGATVDEDLDDEYGPVTTLLFTELDQAKLRGILTRLWDLNRIVISVQRLPPPGGKAR